MGRKKVSRNAPCPCGSGRKYKKCCWNKGFEWLEDEAGAVYRSTPMSPEVEQVVEELRQAFVAKHGREPGPDDPLFSDLPHPEHLEAMMVEGMKSAGLNPAFIYAFEKTGLLVTEQNQHLIPEADLDQWQAAIEEHEAKHGRKDSPRYPLGTLALYGPDDKTTTKIVAGVVLRAEAEPILKRWVSSNVMENARVRQEMQEFFLQHGVKQVAMTEGNLGCPHEEGEDFPLGADCPFCPFWKGKQGSNRRD